MNAIPYLNVVYDVDAVIRDSAGPYLRLSAAIDLMTTELDHQKKAVAFFQERMSALSVEMAELKTNFRVFDEALGCIDSRRLRRKALRLASIMENCERQAGI